MAGTVSRLGDMDYTKDDFSTLGAKLDALDLTDGERAALHAVFTASIPEEEVAGFAFEKEQPFSSYMLGLSFIVLGESDMRGLETERVLDRANDV